MTSVADPLGEIRELFNRAQREEAHDATAAVLATADLDARPAARVILLKRIDERGFVFYTNLESRKARELRVNPRAALCIYWASIAKQVRVEGTVQIVEEDEANVYFASRERGSQLGAWISRQSEPLRSRGELMRAFLKMQARFAGRAVPRPPFWGGYRLVADRIEIWHNQLHRLHDRFLYLKTETGWSVERLYP